MGNNNSTPRVTVKAKGRGPIPPAILNLQNPEYLNSGITGPGVMTSTYATSAPIVPTVPVAAPIAAPMMATATTTDTVISGPMLPPRLPPVPIIDHPIQPGIYGATAVGPSVAETFVVQHQPFVPGVGPAVIDDSTIIYPMAINATAPIQPGLSPQPSPQASLQQQQLLQLQQQQQLLQEEQYFQQQQQTYLQGRTTPPLPAGYADQTQFYQGAAAYEENEASDDDTGSYSSFDEEIFVAPAGADLRARSYTRRSPNFVPTGTMIRDSPPPAFLRESPQPGGFLRESPPLALRRESSPLPLSARTRAAYAVADTPYEPYSRSRAFDRYQIRVNSRMSAYDQTPDQYGFYPNAYRI